MKKVILLPFAYCLLLGCNKETVEYPSVTAYDYVSGQPVDGARVLLKHYYNFNVNCFCYSGYSENQLGLTGPAGRLGQLLSLEGLWVRKEGWYEAGVYDHCYYETDGVNARYGLFKKGYLDIQAQPGRNYTEPVYLAIYPVLKNNQVPPSPFMPDEFWLNGTVRFDAAAYAGLTNRLVVLARRGGGVAGFDTLYRRDVFLPGDQRVTVPVNY